MIKAIIFDMDGVLIDSTKIAWESFNTILNNDGFYFPNNYMEKNLATSLSLRDSLQTWKKEFGLKDYDLMEFSKKAGAIQLDLLKNKKADRSLIKLLKQAKKQNIKCAVATSSLRWRAEAILKLLNIIKFFSVIVTADDVKKHKPNPDVFLKTAELLGVKPKECVVVEDARNGIKAAKNAKMKAIGLVTKYNSVEELQQADLVINNFSKIDIKKIKVLLLG